MFTRLLDPLCFNCIQIRLNRIKGGRTGVGGIDVNSRRVFMVTHNKARFRVPIKTQTGHLAGSILNDRKLIFQTLVGLGSSFEKTKNRIWCRFIIHFQRSSTWFSMVAEKGQTSFQFQKPNLNFKNPISISKTSSQFQKPHLIFKTPISISKTSSQFKKPHLIFKNPISISKTSSQIKKLISFSKT